MLNDACREGNISYVHVFSCRFRLCWGQGRELDVFYLQDGPPYLKVILHEKNRKCPALDLEPISGAEDEATLWPE